MGPPSFRVLRLLQAGVARASIARPCPGRPPSSPRTYRYQAAASCVFFTPIFYVYYEERAGLALSTILAVQSYYLAVRALCDLPLGAVADRWSRPACLAAYALCHVAGAVVLLVALAFATVVAAETLFALGGAFRSGADSAFLFDALQAAGRSDLYPQAESRAQAVIAVATGATAVAGGLLAALDLRCRTSRQSVRRRRAPGSRSRRRASTAPPHRTTSIARLMRDAAGEARRSGAVRWVLALAAFAVVTSHVWYYLQQPYMRAVGVPLAFGSSSRRRRR
jgi:MFS family permease